MQYSHIFRTFLLVSVATMTAPAYALTDATVKRATPDTLSITWKNEGAVDVYAAADPRSSPEKAALLSAKDADGRHEITGAGTQRQYFILKDSKSGDIVHVAERLVPLAQGSNFRDVGGYRTKDGKQVRWGLIYRSGGQPMLNDADLATVKHLGLKNLIDLRSSEERVLAPSLIYGVTYSAVGYSMQELAASLPRTAGEGGTVDLGAAYRNFPTLLTPQLRLLFTRLLANEGPLAYNCSAGQDRTGFATGLLLHILGVPRETIYADYLLSTAYRQPEFEMKRIDPQMVSANAATQMFAAYQKDPKAVKPTPLTDAEGQPFLAIAFAEVEKRHGSVDAYLEKEIGVTKKDQEKLRKLYLEN